MMSILLAFSCFVAWIIGLGQGARAKSDANDELFKQARTIGYRRGLRHSRDKLIEFVDETEDWLDEP